jgi:polyhydroxybutyrate depolymerase
MFKRRVSTIYIAIIAVLALASSAVPAGAQQSTDSPGTSGLFQPAPDCETRQITVGGLDRSYILCVPQNLTGPAPLLLVFHGGGMSAKSMKAVTGYDTSGVTYGFITAFLNGCDNSGCDGGGWNNQNPNSFFYADRNDIDDEGFVRAVVDEIRADYAIDASRIDATGVSDGGMFTYTLACDMSDLFAAVAPISATLMTQGCNPRNGVSIFHYHGGKDPLVPFDGGGPFSMPPVMDGLTFWAGVDGCSTWTQRTYGDNLVSCQQFAGCSAGLAVEWCLVPEADHFTWPVDASITLRDRLMQNFLNHPKR